MFRSRALCAGLVLAFAGTGLGVVGAAPAAGLTPPVGFTADDLPTWQTNGVVWALAQAGDTVFVGGTFSEVRPPRGEDGSPREAVNFVAMNAATGAPTSCRLSFRVGSGTATVRALAVSPDQKTLYAGGYFGSVNGTQVSSLAAIDIASCTPKKNFRAAFPATVRALAVTDDTVYAGGDFSSVSGTARKRFAAVDASTGAVREFRADADEPGRAVRVSADGEHVALGGDFFTVNGADSHALAVVDATTGDNERTYPKGFIEDASVVKTIDADADGFYTGNEGTGYQVFDGRIALDADSFEERWRDTCLGATQSVLADRGVLYSASHAHDCSTMGEFPNGRRHHLMAEPTDDPTLLGWFPDTNDGIGEGIGPRALTIATSGSKRYLWVGGEFTTVNGAAGQGLTRFASGPDVGAPTVPQNVTAESDGPGKVKVSWRSSLDLDDSKLTYKVYRNGSSTPVHTVTAESAEWSRPQLSFTDTDVTAGRSYEYRVTATDGAGNASAKSAAATVTMPDSAAPDGTVHTVTAPAGTARPDHRAPSTAPRGRTVPDALLTPVTGSFTGKQRTYLSGRVPEGTDPAAVLQLGQEVCERVRRTAAHDRDAAVDAVLTGDLRGARAAVPQLCPDQLPVLRSALTGFPDGTRQRPEAGSYRALTPDAACTWRALDAAGKVLASGAAQAGSGLGAERKVTARVPEGTRTFVSRGCHAWVRD